MANDIPIAETIDVISATMAQVSGACLLGFILYEWIMGRYKNKKKTKEDWAMGGLSLLFLSVVQRPLLTFFIFFSILFYYDHLNCWDTLIWLGL